jgi:hypothetical protein
MNEYRLNKVNFKILNPRIRIWVSGKILSDFQKKRIEIFNELNIPIFLKCQASIYYSFQSHLDASEVEINLDENKYFLKPYIDFQLKQYFDGNNLTSRKTFIDSIQIWDYISTGNRVKTYDRFSLKQLGTSQLFKLELLISYDGKSLVSDKPLSEQNYRSPIIKYIQGTNIYDNKRTPFSNKSETYPILSISLRKEIGIPFEGYATKNTYLEYYKKISSFYDRYLKGQTLANNITFYSEAFEEVDDSKIMRTNKVSNYLKFNGNNDFSISSGLKKYGPYKVPDTNNLRFVFIYKNNVVHRKAANQLYLALKHGLENNFPGLKDYVKVKFELALDNKIVLETNEPEKELVEKLGHYKKQDGMKYFAIYLTDHKRFDDLENNESEYYLVKYALLKKEILSQFIYYKNIESKNFKYHLPNIAVAILAKLGGIPWKLDTVSSNKMVIGFGVKRIDDNTYLGNTLSFKDDGEFYKFESYQRINIQTIGDALRDSINKVINQEKFIPDQLIIHYYKTLSDDEALEIEKVLKEIQLNIPFIVLTINDTKSKEYLFFDVASKDIMPVSGTIIEIKNKTEYLLANNERHSETQQYSIRKYPFPLKIKVNKPTNTLYDVFDIKELLDQVYSFSRIYWKSINPISLPVTIAYSKIVADLAAHFPDHRLPELDIAHSNLWFL